MVRKWALCLPYFLHTTSHLWLKCWFFSNFKTFNFAVGCLRFDPKIELKPFEGDMVDFRLFFCSLSGGPVARGGLEEEAGSSPGEHNQPHELLR